MTAVICLLCFFILMIVLAIGDTLRNIHLELQSLHNTMIEIAYNIEDMRGEQNG